MKNSVDLKNFNNKEKKEKRNYYDRLNDAVTKGFSFDEDSFSLDIKNKTCLFFFIDTYLLSNNDLLRISYKKSYKYRQLWKERVDNLVSKIKEKEKALFYNEKVLIEVLMETNKAQKLDYDSSIACLKFLIDGFVGSKLIKDDNLENLPLILTKQRKVKGCSSIKVVISVTSDKEIENKFSDSFNEL